MSELPFFKTPLCPRCHYDQSGDVLRWADSCPVEGLCPECGLHFQWCDLFREPFVPEWWIERDSGRLRFRAVRTLLRSLRPLSFWKRIRLEFSGNLRSSFRLLLFLLACFYLSEAAATAAALYDFFRTSRIFKVGIVLDWSPVFFPFSTEVRPNLLWLLFYAACFPLAATVLPQTRLRAKVAWPHLFRVAIYAAAAALTIQMFCSAIAVALMLFQVVISISAIAPYFPMRYSTQLAIVLWTERARMLSLLVFPPIVTFSWWVACRSYLRLQHATAVAIALTIISALITITIIVTIDVIPRFGFRATYFGP